MKDVAGILMWMLPVVALVVLVSRLFLRIWRKQEATIRYLESERARQQTVLGTLHRVLAGNGYGSGITLPFHVRNIRRVVRILAQDGEALLERTPEIVWWLRAVDDYLVRVGQVTDPRAVESPPLPDYRITYEPLARYIELADI